MRAALSTAIGRRFDLAGTQLAAFPTPAALLKLGAFPGIDTERLDRLHGVARAAADGRLEAARLFGLGPDEAIAEVQQIKGIGPVYASLIVIRAVGFTDVAPLHEPKAQQLLGELYGLGASRDTRAVRAARRGLAAVAHVGERLRACRRAAGAHPRHRPAVPE